MWLAGHTPPSRTMFSRSLLFLLWLGLLGPCLQFVDCSRLCFARFSHFYIIFRGSAYSLHFFDTCRREQWKKEKKREEGGREKCVFFWEYNCSNQRNRCLCFCFCPNFLGPLRFLGPHCPVSWDRCADSRFRVYLPIAFVFSRVEVVPFRCNS